MYAAPELSSTRSTFVPSVKNVATGGALYESGSTNTRRTVGWRAPTSTANQGVLSNLSTLRARSRAATRNNKYAKAIIDRLVTNIIGTGIMPLSQAKDPEMRKAIQDLFLRWTDECDADGQLDFYGMQALNARTWLEGGECFARKRDRLPVDGLSVPLQIQLLEPELCPHTHDNYGQRIRAGIEFSPIGRRDAYYFHPSRPEFDDFDSSQLRRIPADQVTHTYDQVRAGQLRGIPVLTQSLIPITEADKADDAALMRKQLGNMVVAFIKRTAGVNDDTTIHPATGQELETAPDGDPMISMEPGTIQELEPGEEMQFSNPPDDPGYWDFIRNQLMAAFAAAGVPYEVVTGDMRGVNDRTVRLVLLEFRRRVQMAQHHNMVFQFCRPIWKWWMDRVFLSGALPIPADYLVDPTPWSAVKWIPMGWPYMNPTQDVKALIDAVRGGFKSRSAVVSEGGEDAEAIDREQQTDNERADELGLKYDSDGRNPANGSGQPAPSDNGNAGDSGNDSEPATEPARPGAPQRR
jgi:lambda family phage portal protein